MLATLYVTVRKRRLTHVFFDQGVWMHQSRDGSVTDRHVNHRISLVEYERPMTDYWFSVYTPKQGDTIIDIGAGKGEETYSFSKRVGDRGKVIAIEAHPQTFRCLEKLCAYNVLSNVTVLHAAICEKEAEVVITDPESEQFSTIVDARDGFRVQGLPLDVLVQRFGLGRIDFLKMNIEGAERMAIAGMTECIKNIRVACISCHDFLADSRQNEAFRTKAIVEKFLKDNGFTIRSRDHDLRPYIRDQINAVNERLD